MSTEGSESNPAMDVLSQINSLKEMMTSQQERISILMHGVYNEGEDPPEGVGSAEDNSSEEFEAMMNTLEPHTQNIESAVSSEDEILAALADVEQTTDFGPDLSPPIATAFLKSVCRPLSKETSDKLKRAVKVPQNCKEFIPPRMNQEIWNNLPTKARLSDLKNQQIQTTLSYGLVALASISNDIAQLGSAIPKDIMTKLLKNSMDAANLLGHQLQELNQKRKLEVRPFLSQEYKGICSSQTVSTDLLFGANLNETLKTTKAASSLIRNPVNSFNKFNRPRPYIIPSTFNHLNGQRPFHHHRFRTAYHNQNNRPTSRGPQFQNPLRPTHYRPNYQNKKF